MKYNAFISYSQKADGLLAPEIQYSLQKLTKPWNKIRALSIFRDKTDLSASPQLWTNIESAIRNSEYFILIASPEAAKSYWVNKEVELWLSIRPLSTLIIVLSRGIIEWSPESNDFDRNSTKALPNCLYGKYTEEPTCVMFNDVWQKDRYSLVDPQFKAKIAEIAAPIHGKSVGDLIGKDVVEYKRTIRYRNLAIIGLAILLLLSIILTAVAYYQKTMADNSTIEANNQRKKAKIASVIAQIEEAKAKKNLKLANDRRDSIIDAKVKYAKQEQTLESQRVLGKTLNGSREYLKSYILTLNTFNEERFKYFKKKLYSANIYYDYDKYNIRTDGQMELDNVIRKIQDYPKSIVFVESYQAEDERNLDGSEIMNMGYDYILKLSSNRSQSIIKYLINRGIDSTAVRWIGKIVNFNINDYAGIPINELQLLKQQLRRTEITIYVID